MRVLVMVCLVLGLGLAASPARAQEAEVLRQELEQLKQQLQMMQQQYQKTIQDMTDRLQRLEAQPTAPPSVTGGRRADPSGPGRHGAPATAPRPSSQISALDLARPREPFALYERRGPGQLLFDMGVTGDFAGSLTSKRVEQARAGSLPGEENRVFPREIEVSFFGQIDPYARAEVRVEAGDELEEDGTRSLRRRARRSQPDPHGHPLGLPAEGRPHAPPLGLPQRVPPARPALHRQPERLGPLLRGGGPRRERRRAGVGGADALLPPGHPGHLRRRQRRRLRGRDPAGSARHRPPSHVLRA